MKWILAIPVMLLPLLSGFSGTTAGECDCPPVAQLTRTAKSSGSISWSWSGPDEATGYEVWYYREEGNYTSSLFTTTSESFGFTGLSAGHYTFYVGSVCGGQSSSFIGIEDTVEN